MPVIQGPKLTEATYGLIESSFIVVEGSDTEPNPISTGDSGSGANWVQGISWRPEDCDHGGMVAACLSPANSTDPGANASQATAVDVHYPGFVVADVTCSTFGNVSSDEDNARARRKLVAVQSYQLENEFWSGTLAQAASLTGNQYLAKPGATQIEGGKPLGTVTALAELEQFIARNFNERGMIHASPRTVTFWVNDHTVTANTSGTLTTETGTIVVPGRGYNPADGPGTAAGSGHDISGATPADTAWVYCTSLVYVRLGEITTQVMEDSQAIDRDANRRLVRAYRPASANFSPCAVGAALVDHTHDRTTTGS